MAVALKLTAPFDVPDLSEPEAFVAWMEEQPYKLEMAGGRLVMMASGHNAHSRIAANTLTALSNRLHGSGHLVFNADFMVQLTPEDRYYPDATVALEATPDYTDRPLLVAEVLTPGSERFDVRVKLPVYRRKEGLRHILLLSATEPLAWLHQPGRADDDDPRQFRRPGDEVPLPGLGIRLPLAELYADVPLGPAGGA
jgi:Uma2 family endonuclease